MNGIKTFFKTSALFLHLILTIFSSTGCKEDSVPVTTQHQTGRTQFQLTIGGTGNDYATSLARITGGGYVLCGTTNSFGAGGTDFYIVKFDASGLLQWSRTVGGTGQDYYANSIIQTTDGGFAVAGGTASFGAGGFDFYIVKLDGSGTLQWSKTVGGASGDDIAYSIIQTTDGGFAVAGVTTSFGAGSNDMYIVKFDGSGTLQWTRPAGGTGIDFAYSIIQTADGGYAVAGETLSFGAGNDMYIVKLSSSGTLQWSITVGGANSESAYSIIQTTDGDYAVAGGTLSFGAGGSDFYIVKLDASGTLQWSRTVGGMNHESAYSIIQTTDGGYAVAGGTNSFGAGDRDIYIVKLDGSGTLQWSRTVGGTNYESAYSIIQTTDGGYAVAGETYSFGAGGSDMFIVKLDASGNTCANSTLPTSQSGAGGTTTLQTLIIAFPTPTVTTPTPNSGIGGTLTTLCVVEVQPISNETPGSENKEGEIR